MIGMNEPDAVVTLDQPAAVIEAVTIRTPVVTIPGWCSRCFRPCRVPLGVNEALCLRCEKAVERDIRTGTAIRRSRRRLRRAS